MMAQTKCRLDIESVCSKQIPCEACNDLYREEVDREPVKEGETDDRR